MSSPFSEARSTRAQLYNAPCMAQLRSAARDSQLISEYLNAWEHGVLSLEQALMGIILEQSFICQREERRRTQEILWTDVIGGVMKKQELRREQSAGLKTGGSGSGNGAVCPTTKSFFVNGGLITNFTAQKISYGHVCTFAGVLHQGTSPRITFTDGGYEGVLLPGAETIVSEGMKFTVDLKPADRE